jgi:hypothetical protein
MRIGQSGKDTNYIVKRLAVTLIVLAGFFVRGNLQKNIALDSDITVTQEKIQGLSFLLTRKGDIQSRYNSLISEKNLRPSERHNNLSVLSEIEEMAHRSGVRIIDIKQQYHLNRSSPEEPVYQMQLAGTMERFISFIWGMRSCQAQFMIKRFKIKAVYGPDDLEADLSIARALF